MGIAAGNSCNPYVVIGTGPKRPRVADTESEPMSKGWNPRFEDAPPDVNAMIMNYLKAEPWHENRTYQMLRQLKEDWQPLRRAIDNLGPKIEEGIPKTRQLAEKARKAYRDHMKTPEEVKSEDVEELQREWILAARELSRQQRSFKNAITRMKRYIGLAELFEHAPDFNL
jgi:hypothetical protein